MEISDERKRSLVPRVADSPFIKKLRGVKNIKLIAAAFILAAALLYILPWREPCPKGAATRRRQPS